MSQINKTKSGILTIHKSFLLRSINPNNIISEYFKGKYDNFETPKSSIKVIDGFEKSTRKIGRTPDHECYKFTDKIGSTRTIITTNHAMYIWFKNGQIGNPPHTKCGWCRNNVDDFPIGIPIELTYNNENDELICHMEDTFCSFECAITLLRRYNGYNRKFRDPHYKDSEQILHILFEKMYPNSSTIHERPDWRLLDINGGYLTEKEYYGNTHKYVDTKNLILLPVKRKFIKLSK